MRNVRVDKGRGRRYAVIDKRIRGNLEGDRGSKRSGENKAYRV